MTIEDSQSLANNASQEKSIITNDLNNLDAMMRYELCKYKSYVIMKN